MRNWGAMLLLAVLAGCAGDGAGTAPNIHTAVGQGGGTGQVSGTAFIVTPAPDSQFVAFKDVQVALVRVGDLPPDQSGNPSLPPGDTMLTVRQTGLVAPVFLSDTVVPPSGNPPPPPPVACAVGDTVATATTDGAGKYEINQLEPGIYTVLFEPPASAGLSPREICGVAVRKDIPAAVDSYFSR